MTIKFNKIIKNKKLQSNMLHNKKTINMSDYSSKQLGKIKVKNNFTLTKLHEITKVNRGVLERFLDGGKINHIDYLKIIKQFPQIQDQQYTDKKILEVTPITMFGTVENEGFVRGMFLNESKVFYLDKPLTTIFTDELIALHDTFSANKFLCIHRPDKRKFTHEDRNYMFLIKTKTHCLFGICYKLQNKFKLYCHHTLQELNYNDEEIIEVFEMLCFVSGRWSELKDKSFTSVIKK